MLERKIIRKGEGTDEQIIFLPENLAWFGPEMVASCVRLD